MRQKRRESFNWNKDTFSVSFSSCTRSLKACPAGKGVRCFISEKSWLQNPRPKQLLGCQCVRARRSVCLQTEGRHQAGPLWCTVQTSSVSRWLVSDSGAPRANCRTWNHIRAAITRPQTTSQLDWDEPDVCVIPCYCPLCRRNPGPSAERSTAALCPGLPLLP